VTLRDGAHGRVRRIALPEGSLAAAYLGMSAQDGDFLKPTALSSRPYPPECVEGFFSQTRVTVISGDASSW
jgi:hypothetical protein